MDHIIRTAILFINSLLHLDAILAEREDPDFSLSSPYALERENQILRELLVTTPDNAVCFLVDSFQLCHCLAFAGGKVVLLGPYRERTMTRAEARKRMPAPQYDDEMVEQYLRYYNSRVLLEDATVKLAAYTLFVSVYGTTKNTAEKLLNIQQYAPSALPAPEELSPQRTALELEQFNQLSFQYMAHIRQGNYEEAIATYNRIMRYTGHHKTFAMVNTVEGMSNIRTLTRIATQQVGVPTTASHVILEEFKENARRCTSRGEAIKLVQQMISDICRLVRQCRSEEYSLCVRLAVDYIHRNLTRALSVKEIAAQVGLSPNRLSSKFHGEVGQPLTAYVARRRMEEAASLLAYTNFSVQDICAQVGILDSNYFSRAFKKQYGLTPTAYRQSALAPN